MDTFDSDKIVDPELRAFAVAQQVEQRTVIVELGLAPPVVSPFARASELRPRALLPKQDKVDHGNVSDVEGHAEAMDEFEKQLRSLELASTPVRLNAAQAFVVPVTPAQLRALSLLPLAGIIRPNRSHYAPQHG